MYITEARHLAAQCWCDPETEKTEMDVELAEAMAKRIAFWMETAAQNQRNTEYYRGLVQQIGENAGRESYIQDDGGISEDVLCAKVPEVVADIIAENADLKKAVEFWEDQAASFEVQLEDATKRIASLERELAAHRMLHEMQNTALKEQLKQKDTYIEMQQADIAEMSNEIQRLRDKGIFSILFRDQLG